MNITFDAQPMKLKGLTYMTRVSLVLVYSGGINPDCLGVFEDNTVLPSY